ncbi:hypothetical protein [Actinoplanes xinjiangensis]|uniref:hypothetical protein n=1 Tax=Actinoplanes xinjiangensis TaxID=512350 RepID=UPI003419E727
MGNDRLSDAALDGILRMSVGEMRGWLRDNQPERNPDRRFWWENLTYRITFRMRRAEFETEKGRLALLAHGAILESLEQEASDRDRAALKIAELIHSYFCSGGSDEGLFSVDEAVSFILDSIRIDREQAVYLAGNRSSLSADSAREVAAASTSVGACMLLLDRIEDPGLRARAVQWLPVPDAFE